MSIDQNDEPDFFEKDFDNTKADIEGDSKFEKWREEKRETESRERHLRATHQVLDLTYMPDEGQSCYCGTAQECWDFVYQQGTTFLYEVAPLTLQEMTTIRKMFSI